MDGRTTTPPGPGSPANRPPERDLNPDEATPSLRDRKRERTREAILDAATLLFFAHGGASDPNVLTMGRIAELAEVSERTVYRFFPSRADLDRALVERDKQRYDDIRDGEPTSWSAEMRVVMREWSARNGERRVAHHDPDQGVLPETAAHREARDARTLEAIDALLPPGELGPRQRLALVGALQSLVSARVLAMTAQRWGLTLAEAGEAHAWVFETALAALAAAPPGPWDLEP